MMSNGILLVLYKRNNILLFINIYTMGNEALKLKWVVTLIHKNAKWEVLSEETINNIITSVWKAGVAWLVGNTGSVSPFNYIALWSGNTAPAIWQTALVSEITTLGWQRVAWTISRVTTTVTNDTLQVFNTFTASWSLTVEECWIFNSSSAWIMLWRLLTGTKSLSSGDTLSVTYNIVFA